MPLMMAATLGLMPGSPSSVSSVTSPFTPPMSASSPSFMSPRGEEPPSPMSQRQQQTLRSLAPNSSPIVGSPVWRVNREELGRLKRSLSFEMRGNVDEPNLSWVHSLVKESPPEKLVSLTMASSGLSAVPVSDGEYSSSNSKFEGHDQAAVLNAWLKQMHLHQVTS